MTPAERKLIRFAGKVLNMSRGEGFPGDLDGSDIHDAAESCGVLVGVPVDKPCRDEFCACADMDGIPGECFRMEAMVQLALTEAETEPHPKGGV